MNHVISCPKFPEETAEELYFGRLGSATAAFKAHCQDCLQCSKINEETVTMIEAIRDAAKLLGAGKSCKSLAVVQSPK